MVDILRNVPIEERNEIILAVNKIDKHRRSLDPPTKTEFDYIFEIWNTYVQPSNPQDMTCKSCRNYVFSNFKYHIKSWKEYKKSSQA